MLSWQKQKKCVFRARKESLIPLALQDFHAQNAAKGK